MPSSAPANVSVSPKAVRTVGSITPAGGMRNDTVMSVTPKRTTATAMIFCNFSIIFTLGVIPQISKIYTDRHMTLLFFNDNRDNNDNGKNGRNVVCHEVT